MPAVVPVQVITSRSHVSSVEGARTEGAHCLLLAERRGDEPGWSKGLNQ
jgi:hypothetical protein